MENPMILSNLIQRNMNHRQSIFPQHTARFILASSAPPKGAALSAKKTALRAPQ
jgi:hypothetical protein